MTGGARGVRLSLGEALNALGIDASGADDAGALRRAYKRLALKHHPDKNPDDREAAQERFVRVTAAYHFLKSPAGARARDGGDAAGGVAADFDWGAFTAEGGFKMPSLEEILSMALGGTNMSEVDEMLRAVGQHRPPEGFGIAPFPAFTAAERSAEDAKREHAQRTYLESIKADERASAAHECAVAILAEEGDSSDGELAGGGSKDLGLEEKLRRAFAEDGLAGDGTPLDSDSADDLEGW